jgi:hypothetical protein
VTKGNIENLLFCVGWIVTPTPPTSAALAMSKINSQEFLSADFTLIGFFAAHCSTNKLSS